MGPTALFGTIHVLHYTISTNFYFYLQYFQQLVFNFSKISGIQTDPKYRNRGDRKCVWLRINKRKKLKMRSNKCLVRKNNNNK